MGLDVTARRRWFGAIVLALAVLMLILGQTVLKSNLDGAVFVVYWLVCFVLLILSIAVAFRDVRAIHHEARAEQRTLLESALKDIESEARDKQKRTKRNSGKR